MNIICDRIAFLVFTVLMVVGAFTSSVHAQQSFTDTFDTPLGPERLPVTWSPLADNSNISIADGVMTLVGAPTTLAGTFVPEYSATDLVVDTEFEVFQGTDIGVVFRVNPTDPSQCYFANYVRRTEVLLLGQSCESGGELRTIDSVAVPFTTDEPARRMQVQAIGDELSVWFWPANESRPAEPLLSVTDSAVNGAGGVGFFVNETVELESSPRVGIREFSVEVVPEPSSFLMVCMAAIVLVSRLRR